MNKFKKIFTDIIPYSYIFILIASQFLGFVNLNFVKTSQVIRILGFIITCLVIPCIYLTWKKEKNSKSFWLIGIIVLLLLPGILLQERYYMLRYIIAILAVKGKDSKKVLGLLCGELLILFLATVLGSMTGWIENLVTYRDATGAPRYAMGFVYTTYFSGILMAIVASWAYVRQNKISYFEIVCMGIAAFLCHYVSNARIDAFTVALITVCMLLVRLSKNFPKLLSWLDIKWIRALGIQSANLLALIAILMGIFYKFDSPVWQKLSDLLSRRPYSNAITFTRYPVSLWGENIIFHNSIVDGMVGVPQDYYVINCSYILVLASFGICGFLCFQFLWTLLLSKQAHAKQWGGFLILIAYSALFFLEQRMVDICINPFFLLLFCKDEEAFPDFVTFGVPTKVKCAIKRCVYILGGLLIALVIEVSVFNYDYMVSAANKPISVGEFGLMSDTIAMTDDTKLYTYEGNQFYIDTTNVFEIMGIESLRLDFSLYSAGGNEEYVLYNDYAYGVDVYSFQDGDYNLVASQIITSKDPKSRYIPLNLDYSNQLFRLAFLMPEGCQFSIVKMDFNGTVPFAMNAYRVLGIGLLCSGLLWLYNKKKKAGSKGEQVIEDTAKDATE